MCPTAVAGTLGLMADLHYRNLRRRRRVYEIRAGSGFEGYVSGSWQHGFQSLLRPFNAPVGITAASVTVGFGSIFLVLVVRGADPVNTAALSGAVTLGLWLVAGTVSFLRLVRRVHSGPPPPPRGPGSAGVREPRGPTPDPGILAAEIDPPSHSST